MYMTHSLHTVRDDGDMVCMYFRMCVCVCVQGLCVHMCVCVSVYVCIHAGVRLFGLSDIMYVTFSALHRLTNCQ